MGNSKKFRMRAPLGLAVLLVGFGVINASADTLYNDIPVGLTDASPDFSYSLPFYESGVSAFGDLINPNAGTITQGTVALSDWATLAQYTANGYLSGPNPLGANSTGYNATVTVNIYSQGTDNSTPAATAVGDSTYNVGPLVDSSTTTAFINWGPNGTSGAGSVNLVNFLLNTPLVTDGTTNYIYTVSVNTGLDSNGNPLPTDSLNFGLNPFDPTVGTNPQGDTAYLNGPASFYTQCSGSPCSGAPGGSLYADIGWGDYGGALALSGSTPEPATFGLIGFGLIGLSFVARKKKNRKV